MINELKRQLVKKTLDNVQEQLLNFLNSKNLPVSQVSFERSSDQKFGDFSTNIALTQSKRVGLTPIKMAQEIVEYLSHKQLEGIERIEYVNPGFINFFLNNKVLTGNLLQIIDLESNFGRNSDLKDEKWVVEHTSPNPNKAMHLGHLRNNLVGMSLVRILKWNGAEVISDAVDNNRGIAIAKLMWGFLSHMRKGKDVPIDISFWVANPDRWYTPVEKNILPDIFVTECYVLGESDFKQSKEIEEKARELVVRWENKEKIVWQLWSYVLSYAYQGIERTLTRLGSHWDKVWHEHEHYEKGKEYVQHGLEKGIFTKLEDGAILTNLEKYNLPDTILIKNDGTSLYITQDIALTALKKEYYKADKLIWVIGPEQSLALKQLFAVCEQLGIGIVEDFTHVAYGYVGLKDDEGNFKKMSSRAGTVVLIDDVIDGIKNKILSRFESEGKSVPQEDLKKISEKLALGAVKFSILKSDRTPDLVFDTEKSIETTGDSGVYVLYTYVRTQSILRKGQRITLSLEDVKIDSESEIIRLLVHFPEIIRRSKQDLSAHHVAQYLLELCSVFNSWYGKEVVLDGSERENYKLAVTKSVGIVIRNGLSILGIDTVEQI